jgi:hypothetical protein
MKRLTPAALAASILILLSATAMRAQGQGANPSRRKLAVEVKEEPPSGIQAHVSETPEEWSSMETSPRRRLPGWSDPPGAIPLTRVRLRLSYEGDAVRIKVAVVFDDSEMRDAPGPKYGAKEQELASYLAREGETVSVEEMRRYGFEPMVLRVVEARPRAAEPLLTARPEVANNLKSVEVLNFAGMESRPNSYKLRLRNVSPKNVTALEIYESSEGGRSSLLSQGTTSRPVMKAGDEYETEFHFSVDTRKTPQGVVSDAAHPRTLVVGTVIFDDGTYEGDVEVVARNVAAQKGQQIQQERAATLIQNVLAARSLDAAGAIRQLKAEVATLRIDVEPSVMAGLLAQFPELPKSHDTDKRLNMEVMNGLKSGREMVLHRIRELEASLARNPEGVAFRQRLTSLKEDLERQSGAR